MRPVIRVFALLLLFLTSAWVPAADDANLATMDFSKARCLVDLKDNPCKELSCQLTECTGRKWTDRSGDQTAQLGKMMKASQACREENPQLVADLKTCQAKASADRDEQLRRQRNKTVEGDRELMSWYEADAALPQLAATYARETAEWARHELEVYAESSRLPGGLYEGQGPAPNRARVDELRNMTSGIKDRKAWFKDWHEGSKDYGDACQVWWAFEHKHHPCCMYPPGFGDANAILGLAWNDAFGTTNRALTMMYKDDPATRQAAARVLGASGWAKVPALESLQEEQLSAMLDKTNQVCLGQSPVARVEVRISVSLPGHRSQQDVRQLADSLGQVTLSGTVRDADGKPLPGASVTVSADGSQSSASSGADGRWQTLIRVGKNGTGSQGGIDFTLTSTGIRLLASHAAAGEGEVLLPCGDNDGTVTVSDGMIVDSFGKAVVGAEIRVADQKAAALSDKQGRFSLKAGIGSGAGTCAAPKDTRITLAFPLQIDVTTTHVALPGVSGTDRIPAEWVFAQAEDLPIDVAFSVDGDGVHPSGLRIEVISPNAQKFTIDSLTGSWREDAIGRFHWDGILPAHATLSTDARDWTLLISAEYTNPGDKRTLKGELRRPFKVIEDPRLTAAELKANFDWLAAWWQSHTQDGPVRTESDSLLGALQHKAGNLLRTGLAGFGAWGYPRWGYGPYNNFALNYGTKSGSERHQQLLDHTCGAYTARTLNTLNRLRYSDDPAVRRRLLGIEYTPVTHWPSSVDGNDWYNHVAVLLYAQGYDHLKQATTLNLAPGDEAPGSIRPRGGLATVLEPWWEQTAELMTVDTWMDKFVSGGHATGRIGLMEADADWASAARVPGVPYSQYAGKEIDKAGSAIELRPVASAARTRYLSSLSPVHLLVQDTQGRRFGFDAQGNPVREIPGAEFEIWPAEDGHRIEHLYLPEGDYTLSVQGVANGQFGLIVSDEANGLAYYPADTPIRAGETARLALVDHTSPGVLVLANGARVTPKLAGGSNADTTGTDQPAMDLAIPTDGLLAWFPFDGDARDATGNGHDGNAAQVEAIADRFGRDGHALLFDGARSGVTLPDNPLTGQAYSVSLWLKGKPDPQRDWARFADTYDHKTKTGWNLFRNRNGGLAAINVYNTENKGFGLNGARLNDEWQHLVAVVDGTLMRLYEDGELVGEKDMGKPTRHSAHALTFGNGNDGYNDWPFKGALDDIRLYGRALTEAEVVALFAEPPADAPATTPSTGSVPGQGAVDAVTACQHAKEVWAQAVRNWHTNKKADSYRRTMLLAQKQYQDCMLKHGGKVSTASPTGPAVGTPATPAPSTDTPTDPAMPPLPAGASLVIQTGFDTADSLADWTGTAKDRKVTDGVASFKSGNHDPFLLKGKVPLENVVFEWRGAARENGFHGSFGPYHFNLGGWSNNGAGYHGPGVKFVKVPAGKVYVPEQFQLYRVERIGDRYRASVDGKLIFDALIPGRADTPEGEFRFTSYSAGLKVDWFRVYIVPGSAEADLGARDFGLAADQADALPAGACLAYGTGFDSVAALGDWGGTASKRRIEDGIAAFRSDGHAPFSLTAKVPVEDVVLEWVGSAKGNGFHGHLGPYHFNLGGWSNTGSGYSGPGVKFVKVKTGKVYEDGKLHRYRLERRDDHWRASIDGRELFDGKINGRGDSPTGELRFTSYGSDLRIDWIRLWYPNCPK
ncbi:MAG: hypothetical protein H6926_07785 [Chromatiales bacterium]|nr:hypothetical protein [Chromatiales bacterium]